MATALEDETGCTFGTVETPTGSRPPRGKRITVKFKSPVNMTLTKRFLAGVWGSNGEVPAGIVRYVALFCGNVRGVSSPYELDCDSLVALARSLDHQCATHRMGPQKVEAHTLGDIVYFHKHGFASIETAVQGLQIDDRIADP